MRTWLVVNHFLVNQKFGELNALLKESAERCGVRLEVRTNAEILSHLTLGGSVRLSLPDFVLFWDKDVTLASALEALGLRVFNSSFSIAACDNKGLTHAILSGTGIKMPKTIIAPLSFKKENLEEFVKNVAETLSFPLIIKESCGSFGEQVYMADNIYDAVDIANTISPSNMIFQEFVSSSAGRDVRINVVGGEVAAAMERSSDSDFRANVTLGGKMKAYKPSAKEADIALRAAKALRLDFGGVDLLFGEDGPLLCEVNSNAHLKNILDCTNINVADKIFEYIKKRLGA